MSTHNICFCGEIRKICFWLKNIALSGGIYDIHCRTDVGTH